MVRSIGYVDGPPETAETIVIGGGVVGAATAFHAARSGFEVTLLEKRPALCTLTTPASTGAFRLQFDNLEELTLVRESVELFLNFEEVTEQSDYSVNVKQRGYLWVTTDEARARRARELVELQHSWGQDDIEVVEAEEIRRRWPYVTGEAVLARFRADDGFLDPKALTMGLTASSGADVATGCAVTGFDIRGGRLRGVKTTVGDISCERAVIAAGPFSGIVAKLAGIDLPVVTVPRQKLVMPDVAVVPSDAPMTIDDDTGAHWRPALGGAYLLFTDPRTQPTDPAEDVPGDHHQIFQLLDPASPHSVARIAPFWRDVWERNAVNWMLQTGQYTVTPDHRPLLGQTAIEGLFVNTGYSGHGIMGSAAGSRHLTDVMRGAVSEADNAFALSRAFVERSLDVL